MTDVSLQKTAKTASREPREIDRERSVRQFCPLAPRVHQRGHSGYRLFLAIETSDFDRRLQLVETSHAGTAAGMYGTKPRELFNR
jgi:hypothetical protein